MSPVRNIESIPAACRGQYLTILEGDDYWISLAELRLPVSFWTFAGLAVYIFWGSGYKMFSRADTAGIARDARQPDTKVSR